MCSAKTGQIFDCVQPAFGATLIEHSLMEVGLSGSMKVDSDVAQGTTRTFECDTPIYLLQINLCLL